MTMETIFPKLKYDKKLKKFKDYVLLYGYNPSEVKVIHPSHAFILSLCTGAFSRNDIEYVFRETYNLSEEESKNTLDGVFSGMGFVLDMENAPSYGGGLYYPNSFIYSVDEEQYRLAKHYRLPVPAGININLTLNCNFKCHYCYQVVQNAKKGTKESLDLEKCLSLIRDAAESGMVHIGLTGGEPTLFTGWITLLEEIISHGMYPTFTSNGSIIGKSPSYARRLREIGLREITISLDSSYASLHHVITNSSHSFSKVVNAIRFLVAEDIRVTVKYVLTPINFHDLEDFIDFIVELGVQEVGISSMEGGAVGSPANSLQYLNSQQLEAARGIVMDKARLYYDKCRFHPPRESMCAWGDDDYYPCGGLSMGMSIFPSGEVSICDKLEGVEEFCIGNVFQQSLMQIWEGSKLEQLCQRSVDVSQIDTDCAKCNKIDLCKTGCFIDSYNTFGNYFAKHPNCQGYFNEDNKLILTI